MRSYHFCQLENSVTCRVGDWVHSLASQLSQAPGLKPYHQLLSMDHQLRQLLSVESCARDPHTALTEGVLQPLTRISQAGQLGPGDCLVLLDALCDSQAHRPEFGQCGV